MARPEDERSSTCEAMAEISSTISPADDGAHRVHGEPADGLRLAAGPCHRAL